MKWMAVVLAVSVMAIWLGCSREPTGFDRLEGDPSAADSIARFWFEALADSLETVGDKLDPEFGDEDLDYVRNMSFAAIREGFESAIEEEALNGLANLGLGLMELVELNYDAEIWEMVDSLEAMDEDRAGLGRRHVNPLRGGLIGREFRILAEAPLAMAMQLSSVPENVTVARFQELVVDKIIPRLGGVLARVDAAERDLTFSHDIEDDGETYQIDMGEVYYLDASVRALRAGLRVLVSYNAELYDESGTYDWLQEETCFVETEVIDVAGTTTLTVNYGEWDEEIFSIRAVRHQMTRPGSDFLTLRSDPSSSAQQMEMAHDDLLGAIAKLYEMLDYVYSEEPGDQENDVIKIGDLDDLMADIDDCPDCPQFVRDWDTLYDVIDWLEQLLSGPYHFDDVIEGQSVVFDVDLSALFNAAVQDWKALLPYHEWRPEQEWVGWDVWGYDYPWNPGEIFSVNGCDDHVEEFDGIEWVNVNYIWVSPEEDPVHFLDGPGGSVIDPDLEMPYAPDYTFGGIFPGMTRGDWDTIWQDARD